MNPVNKKLNDHLEATRFWGPSNNTILSIHYLSKFKRRALDLGCGSLRNSKFLFNSGLIVDAIDKDPKVKKFREFFKGRPKGLFNLKIADYLKSNLGEEKYDIVVAQNCLSFNNKNDVKKIIIKIYKALKMNGYFAGNIYGIKDFRVGKSNTSFYTKNEAASLLRKFKLIWLTEDKGDGEESGKKFHWDTYEFLAQKGTL